MNKAIYGLMLTICLSGCFHSDDETSIEDDNAVDTSYFLNDTGTTSFLTETINEDGSSSFSFATTASDSLPGQDAATGLDVSHSNNDDGLLGFSFRKLDSNGTALENQDASYVESPWHCVYDNNTGLTWEVKTNTGLQNSIHRFAWYNTDSLTNGGNAGDPGDSSSCGNELSFCNTQQYTAAINTLNSTGLCQYNDWRLPTREELRSLIHYGIEEGNAMIDTRFFPFTAPTDHWTSQTAIYADPATGTMAWEVHFEGGHSEGHNKQSEHVAVRLVRGPGS